MPTIWSASRDGRITGIKPGPFITPNYSFALRASRDAWEKLWSPKPIPGFTDIFALVKKKLLRIEGDLHPFMTHLLYFKGVLAAARERRRRMSPRFEPAIGRYLHLDLLGRPHRLYVEEAGTGIPLLCLHTAGSDGRQYRGLLNDPRITKNYRVIVFDMPWHGKSSPPVGWENEEYRLTSRDYVRMILEVSAALELDKPVVMGCSIGGRIVLHLAHEHPEKFRAIVGLESSPKVDPYYDVSWLHRADVHGGEVCAGIVSGLVAPTAPDEGRWETLWHYMQSGPGVFKGDLYFYMIDGDISDKLDQIDARRCPLYLLTGEYDYSCTTEGHARSREAHRRAGDHHAGPRPLPDEREPGKIHRLPAAGARRNPHRKESERGMKPVTTLGFIGLGVMGEPMCRNLVTKTKLPVYGTDLKREPVERLAAQGLKACASIADVAQQADAIFLSLHSPKAVEDVCDTIAAAKGRTHIIVDMSTTPVKLTQRAACAPRQAGHHAGRRAGRRHAGARPRRHALDHGRRDARGVRRRAAASRAHGRGDALRRGELRPGREGAQQHGGVHDGERARRGDHHRPPRRHRREAAVRDHVEGLVGLGRAAHAGAEAPRAGLVPRGCLPDRLCAEGHFSLALELAKDVGVNAPAAQHTRDLLEATSRAGYGRNYYPAMVKLIEKG